MKGILFKPEMIQAIQEGRKTQTRRIIKSKHESGLFQIARYKDSGNITEITSLDWNERPKNGCTGDIRPKYKVGEVIYVKESYRVFKNELQYRIDGHEAILLEDGDGFVMRNKDGSEKYLPWKNAMFVPASSARIFLEITNVRVEKLREITAEDCLNEGIAQITKDGGITWKYGIPDKDGLPGGCDIGWPWSEWELTPQEAFKKLWIKVNKGYEVGQYLFVYEFKKVERP